MVGVGGRGQEPLAQGHTIMSPKSLVVEGEGGSVGGRTIVNADGLCPAPSPVKIVPNGMSSWFDGCSGSD